MVILYGVLLTASVTMGQADKPADPHLQQLAPIIGDWVATFDVPEMTLKEAKVRYQWILDGRFLEGRWYSMDGKELGPELFTWDPVTESIRMWGFDLESFYDATWQIDGRKWTGDYSATRFTGERMGDRFVLQFEGDSTILLKFIPSGSEQATGAGKFVRDVKQPASLEHLQAFANDFVGNWVGEFVIEDAIGPLKQGDTYTAQHSYTWSPDRESLHLTYSAQAEGQTFDTTKGIAGWDAARQAIVVRWFDSLGSTGELTFAKDGQAWKYDWVSTDGEGQKYTWNSTVTVEGDVQRVHDTNRMIKGEAKPDLHLTWKRKS